MRVTNNMMANTVVFNMQRSLNRFMNLQTSMSSGRRINKPSDDPLGTLRDLDYRAELSKITQFRDNISQGQNWLTTYDSVLSDINNLLGDVKEIAVTMSNATYDAVQRAASAEEAQAIFDRLIQLGNTQLGGRQMFSGFKTKTKPFTYGSNGVVYQGNDGKIEFEIESSVRQPVNITGAETFLKPFSILGEDADVNIGLTVDVLLADLNDGNGVDQTPGTFTVTDLNLNIVSTVDISGAATVNDALTTINQQLSLDGIDMTVSLGDEGNNLKMNTTQSGLISTFTKLAELHNGAGLEPPADQIQITDGGSIDVTIDLASAETIGDIITAFNTQMAAAGYPAVTIAVNAGSTGLVINDTSGPPLDLTIEDYSVDDHTASQLGITGFVGASLTGLDLEPQVSFAPGWLRVEISLLDMDILSV